MIPYIYHDSTDLKIPYQPGNLQQYIATIYRQCPTISYTSRFYMTWLITTNSPATCQIELNPNFTHHMESKFSVAVDFPRTQAPQATVCPFCWKLDRYSQQGCSCFDFHDPSCVSLGAYDQPRLWLAICRHLSCKVVYNRKRYGVWKLYTRSVKLTRSLYI